MDAQKFLIPKADADAMLRVALALTHKGDLGIGQGPVFALRNPAGPHGNTGDLDFLLQV
jgi:hypothetical protein